MLPSLAVGSLPFALSVLIFLFFKKIVPELDMAIVVTMVETTALVEVT